MDAQVIAQRDFSAGQIDPTALRADDTDIMRAGLRTARNVRILASRSLRRRPGRRVLFPTNGISEIIRPAAGVEWFMSFEPATMIFRSRDLSLNVQFTGMPWSAEILTELRWTESGGTIIVAHRTMRPQVQAVANERLKALGLEGDAAAAYKRGENARTTSLLSQSKNILSLGQDVAGFFK